MAEPRPAAKTGVRETTRRRSPCRLRLILERSDVEHPWKLVERITLLEIEESDVLSMALLSDGVHPEHNGEGRNIELAARLRYLADRLLA